MLNKNKNVGMVSGLIPTRIICLFLSWHSRVIISWDDWLFFLQGKKVEFNLELLGYSNHYRIVLISLILVDLFYFGIVLMNEWNGLFLISVHKGRFFSESMMHFSNCPINVQKPILNKIFKLRSVLCKRKARGNSKYKA